ACRAARTHAKARTARARPARLARGCVGAVFRPAVLPRDDLQARGGGRAPRRERVVAGGDAWLALRRRGHPGRARPGLHRALDRRAPRPRAARLRRPRARDRARAACLRLVRHRFPRPGVRAGNGNARGRRILHRRGARVRARVARDRARGLRRRRGVAALRRAGHGDRAGRCDRALRAAVAAGARVSIDACLTFDVDAEAPILVESALYARNAGVMSHQAYGPLVGVPRILDLLREYALPATFFIPGWTADRYPATVDAILAAGHEVGHHSYAHYSPFAQTEEEERADFERALATLRGLGAEVEGFRCPSWEPGWRTPQIVAEHGLAYDSSLMDSDKPYVLDTGAGEIVELPVHW